MIIIIVQSSLVKIEKMHGSYLNKHIFSIKLLLYYYKLCVLFYSEKFQNFRMIMFPEESTADY